MKSPVAEYHGLVDALVSRRQCIFAARVREGRSWPASSTLAEFNTLLDGLTQAQRQKIAELLQRARDGGIHDVLVELSERQNLKGLRFIQGDVELAMEPHGTEMYFDWAARIAGEAWPREG